jgi:hypothetical protein
MEDPTEDFIDSLITDADDVSDSTPSQPDVPGQEEQEEELFDYESSEESEDSSEEASGNDVYETEEPGEVSSDQEEGEHSDPSAESIISNLDKPESWEDVVNQLEKRRRDTQATYTKEHEENLRLKKRIEELETKSESLSDDDDDDDEEVDFYDDPEAAMNKMRAEHKREIENLRIEMAQAEQQKAFEISEAETKAKYDDYDSVVTDFLVSEMESSPYLVKEWQSRGGTPEDAYRLGQELKALRHGTLAPKDKPPSARKKKTTSAGSFRPSAKPGAISQKDELAGDPLAGIFDNDRAVF